MKKILKTGLLLLAVMLLPLNFIAFADSSEVIYAGENQVYFSFTDYPAVALTDVKLRATVTVTWADVPCTAEAQWYYNGMPVEGFYNANFEVKQGATSTLNYDLPRWETMPLDGYIGFMLTVDGVEKFIDVPVTVQNYPYAYYHKAEADRVFAEIKHVYVDAAVIQGTNAYTSYTLSKVNGWLPAGTKAKYIDYTYETYDVYKHRNLAAKLLLDNGYTCWVPYDAVRVSGKNYTVYSDFSNDDKEIFVNAKGYESSSDWLVWVNLERQKVNVFYGSKGNWKIHSIFPCATGKNTTPTIDGVFKYSRYTPKWDFDTYYVKYVMVFNGGHAFHSRTYRTSTDKVLDETIGTTTSLGCVRLYDDHVLWMRDNLPIGTTVVVY